MPPNAENFLASLNVNRLPTLPHVLVDMIQACQGHQASFQELSSIISRDAAISARVVMLANSSFYSRGVPINSLERALLVLGIDTVKTIVITASIQQFFSGFSSSHQTFLTEFWRRSLSCALVSQSLAILTSYADPEEAYLTGLLHNIGELVLLVNHPDKMHTLLSRYEDEPGRCAQEQQVFTMDHCELGAKLVRSWGLSEFAGDAIEFHHTDVTAIRDAHHLVKLIYLSSLVSHQPIDNSDSHYDAAQQLFELNASLLDEIVSKINGEVIEISESMDIRLDDTQTSNADHKQIALAKQVRNLSLVQSTTGEISNATSMAQLTRALQTTLDLLFGYQHSTIFWYQSDTHELEYCFGNIEDGPEGKIKLDPARSYIANAALSGTIEFVQASPSLTVIDKQVLRHLQQSCFICIPVTTDERLFCVLVAGCPGEGLPNENQKRLLHFFAQQAAVSCEHCLTRLQSSQENQEIEHLKQLANEIAHEANNPLSIIGNYLSALAEKLSGNQAVKEELSILKEEVERTGQILLRLKDLQGATPVQQNGVDINHEIESLAQLYKSALFLNRKIKCELNLDAALVRHDSSRNNLRQVITNLIKNAVEALQSGGKISIATTAKVNVSGQDYIEILVQDDGPGIPDDILSNLFSPVNSTKGSGHSGLGLSITKNLVKEAKGTISCRSNKNGTTFQILLPIKTSSS